MGYFVQGISFTILKLRQNGENWYTCEKDRLCNLIFYVGIHTFDHKVVKDVNKLWEKMNKLIDYSATHEVMIP